MWMTTNGSAREVERRHMGCMHGEGGGWKGKSEGHEHSKNPGTCVPDFREGEAPS